MLWLLPLLFFSSSGEALHNHPLFSRVAAQPAGNAGTEYSQPVAPLQHAAPDCFTCRWAAQSDTLGTSSTFKVPQAPLVVVPYTGHRMDFVAWIDRDARGPPFELAFRAVPIRSNNSKEIENEKSQKDGVHLD